MLSRTAENLFWIARYIGRAETMARLLEVGARIALMPSAGHGYRSEWESLVITSYSIHYTKLYDHVRAGADMIAPSGMMDGMVQAIRAPTSSSRAMVSARSM